ncbi:MAG: transposase [Geminicoccaceae bacterium]
MMGRQASPARLFYDFCLDEHVPSNHLLRQIDVFVDLESIRQELKPFYSSIGRPSIDPELMIRMLIIGYCLGIRSERRLCEEVHLNLAYQWFCGLGLDGRVPDHSTFSRDRHGRFRQSDLLRRVFEKVVQRCLDEGLVGGEASRKDRKKVEMLFAHLKRILKLGRLRLRGPRGASDEFLLAATAQNLRKLTKLRPKLEPIAALV